MKIITIFLSTLLMSACVYGKPIRVGISSQAPDHTNITYTVNGLAKSTDEFNRLLRQMAGISTNQLIVVVATKTNTFKEIVHCVEELRNGGLRNVHVIYSVETDRPDLSRGVTIEGLEPEQPIPPQPN